MAPLRSLAVLALALAALVGISCDFGGTSVDFRFTNPEPGTLLAAGPLEVELALPADLVDGTLQVFFDGAPVAVQVHVFGSPFHGRRSWAHVSLPAVQAGSHELFAWARVPAAGIFRRLLRAEAKIEAIVPQPPECEELNAVECLLPYPSSKFLKPANTTTGVHLDLPAVGMPSQFASNGPHRLLPDPYKVLDGFSPTVQILMNFPGGVDPVTSNASRLLPERRGPDGRSLDPDSPTILIDAETGEHILHWIENDIRATDPTRVVTFLRPGKSLTPGRRYIVAVRDLERADGSAVTPEPSFAALRDARPITIASLSERQPHFEDIFQRLAAADVPRENLILAFDFSIQSDHGLTHQMLSMRDQAFAWLDALPEAEVPFTVDDVILKDDCSAGGSFHSEVRGTFKTPLFLGKDPITQSNSLTFLNVDEDGEPTWDGATFTNPPFTIATPCAAIAGESASPKRGVVIGHGLFGTGRGFIGQLVNEDVFTDVAFVAGATDWRGLSQGDIDPLAQSFVVNQVLLNFDNFAALPDRLRQGQLNTLVLARMMRTGIFNRHEAFQNATGGGVISDELMNYFGGSLGGIMGSMFAALTPDVINLNLDVPGINFSCLLQRATPFLLFQDLLRITGLEDPMIVAMGLTLTHELWVRGEPAGYVTHVTSNPLPGANAKNVLISQAFLDQQVSNQCTEIMARSMNVPMLVGSNHGDVPGIPDLPGPLTNAYVEYDTGSFDLDNPDHAKFIPPLANLQATENGCDPHGLQGLIPASLEQLKTFFEDGGIVNYCTGPGDLCDTVSSPGALSELPRGEDACNPTK